MKLIKRLLWYWCELQWLFQLLRGLRKPRRIREAEHRIFLRKILRKTPNWIRGHLLLGAIELGINEDAGRGRDSRLLAGIRVSANAALQLSERLLNPSNSIVVYVEAHYLLGMIAFHSKEFDQALIKFNELLDERYSVHLSEKHSAKLLECAAASAIALDHDSQALSYFKKIPARFLSKEAQVVISRLEQIKNSKVM